MLYIPYFGSRSGCHAFVRPYARMACDTAAVFFRQALEFQEMHVLLSRFSEVADDSIQQVFPCNCQRIAVKHRSHRADSMGVPRATYCRRRAGSVKSNLPVHFSFPVRMGHPRAWQQPLPQWCALGHSPAPELLDGMILTFENIASSLSLPHLGHLILLFSRSLIDAITLNTSPHSHFRS